jgi:hypothetical protein
VADIGYAKLPVPGGGQSPTMSGDMAALASAIDPHLVQFVADAAERDSLYADAPVHTIVSAADGTVWKKTSTSSNSWVTWWEPTPAWVPITLAAGIGQSGDVVPSVCREGNQVFLLGAVNRNDGTTFNAEAVKLGTVPSDCIPPQLRRYVGGCSMAGDTTDAAGRIEILGTSSSSAYGTAGDILWWYQGTGGTSWVDLTGSYRKDGPA